MQTTQLPEAGKTYQSTKNKGFIIEVLEVIQEDGRFYAHSIDKTGGANNRFVLWQEEWISAKFTDHHP